MKYRFSVAVCLCMMMGQALLAGVVFEVETKDHTESAAETSEISSDGKNLKMSVVDKGKHSETEMIFRADPREMLVVDHQRKSYMVLDMETMKALAGQMNSAMSQMQEALKNVPESQRAMMEKMMKGRMPEVETPKVPKTEIRKTDKRAKLNGYPCQKYDVFKDSKKIREMWVTDWKNIEGGKDVAEVFRELGAFFEELLASIKMPNGANSFSQMSDNMFAQMKQLNGFPVVTKDFNDDGSLDSESSLRSAKRRKLDPAEFEPPAGYKRQQMFPGR